jgi:hypothetical protein
MFAFCSDFVKRLPARRHSRFKLQRQDEWLTTKEEPLRNWIAIAALLAVSLTASPARAWWDGGHMQIAAVAYDRLDPGGSRQGRCADQT